MSTESTQHAAESGEHRDESPDWKHFTWLHALYPDLDVRVSLGKYMDRAVFHVKHAPFTPKLTTNLVQNVGWNGEWLVEHVMWVWFGGHIGMNSCTFVRTTPK